MIIGQDKILKRIDSYDNMNFPRSVILLGPKGCGKHLVAEYIANKFNADQVNLIETLKAGGSLDKDLLDEIYTSSNFRVVITTAKDLAIKAETRQNMLLKYIEEPSSTIITLILCEDKKQLLPTILNRCQIFEFEKYNKETLAQFADGNEMLLNIAKTPGQVEQLKKTDFDNIINLSNLIFDKINIASLPNTLTLSNKIAFDGEQDKFDFDLFVDVLVYTITNKIIQSNEPRLLSYYELTRQLSCNRYLPGVSMKYLFENYLVELREI